MTESRIDWHGDDDHVVQVVDDIPPEVARAARARMESELWNLYVDLDRRFRVTPPAIAVTMWRCTRCGKWSHARKRPKTHQRWTTTAPADDEVIIERVMAEYDHLNGFTTTGGWLVECGPFERWTAYPTSEGDGHEHD